jgi:excisionase family DNA binding protein
MSEEKLLTVRDVSSLLTVSEKEVMDLAENGSLPAYKIGGVYLRFKKEQVLDFRKKFQPFAAKVDERISYPLKDKIRDFLYFNDFYILTGLIVFALLFVILKGY